MSRTDSPRTSPLDLPSGVPFDPDVTGEIDVPELDDSDEQAAERVDGRRLRRERNREAVVDAILELYAQSNYSPSSEEIAEIAGISARSLFRYFDDLDDLVRTAVSRQVARIVPQAQFEIDPAVPFVDRCARFVHHRVDLLEDYFELARAVRLRAPFQAPLAEQLRTARRFFRLQVAQVFEPELSVLADGDAVAALAAIDVLCSFESLGLLRDDQGLDRAAIDELLVRSIQRLLEV